MVDRSFSKIVVAVCLVGMIVGMTGIVVAAADPTTFVIGISSDPKSIAPTGTNMDACVAYRVFSSLTQVDKDWKPVPDLAESWEISADALTYTFHLNRTAKFHDGTPVTSEDVKFSILELANALVSHSRKGLLPSIDSIDTPDDYTIVFQLSQVYPDMMDPIYGIGPRCTMVLKKADWEGTDYFANPYNMEPIGSGPFKFVEWVRGSHIVLERWEDYWGEKPAIEKIVYRIIPDPMAMVLAFENGEIDWSPYAVAPSEVERLNLLPGRAAAFHATPCGGSVSLRFNLRKEMFQDIAVRRAFAYAINRERIPELAYFGGASTSAKGYVSNDVFCGWWNNPNVHQVPYDPEIAKTLLDKAGYPVGANGWRFHTTVKLSTFMPAELSVCELLKADLAKVGIDMRIIALDRAAWMEQCFENWDFDLTLGGLCNGPSPPALGRFVTDNILRIPWTNEMGFSNLEYDVLHVKTNAEGNKEKRLAYLYRMQEILLEEQPMVFLVHYLYTSVWNTARFVAEPVELWRGGLAYNFMHLTGVRPAG